MWTALAALFLIAVLLFYFGVPDGPGGEVREMALAHAIGDGTVAAYQRSDLFEKRRNLMADWAKFIQAAQVVGNNVLPMHKAA